MFINNLNRTLDPAGEQDVGTLGSAELAVHTKSLAVSPNSKESACNADSVLAGLCGILENPAIESIGHSHQVPASGR